MKKLVRNLTLLFLLLLSFTMQAKDTIIYVFDPMCGWCYGFSNVIKKLSTEYQAEFDFKVISGGMVVGEREGEIGDFADYILDAYHNVEKSSGIKFGEPYLKQLRTKKLHTSSVIPSIAIEVFKTFHPMQAIAFASDVQRAYYFDGLDLRSDQVYKDLIKPYGINETEFLTMLHSQEYKQKAFDGFQESAGLGVNGYPAVLAIHNGKYYALTRGFTNYDQLKGAFEKLKSLK